MLWELFWPHGQFWLRRKAFGSAYANIMTEYINSK